MNAQRKGWEAIVALSIACTAGLSDLSLAQSPPATGETVPRAEYEQLRKDMRLMQSRIEALETARPTTAPAGGSRSSCSAASRKQLFATRRATS